MPLYLLPVRICPICSKTLFPPSGVFPHFSPLRKIVGAPSQFMFVVRGVALYNLEQGGKDPDACVPPVGAWACFP